MYPGGAQSEGEARTCERRRREPPNGGSGGTSEPVYYVYTIHYTIHYTHI